MFVTYQNQRIELDDGVDVGYSVEKINMAHANGDAYTAPTRGVTTLLISSTFIDSATLSQLIELDKEFDSAKADNFEAIFVLNHQSDIPNGFKFIKFVQDTNNDYGIEFGTSIASGPLKGKLAKAIFVIGRDHVLFYKELCKNLEDTFNIERLYQHLGKALNIYTGTGCH